MNEPNIEINPDKLEMLIQTATNVSKALGISIASAIKMIVSTEAGREALRK